MRARLQVDQRHRLIGFRHAGHTNTCDIEECEVLLPKLNDALGKLRSALFAADGGDHNTEVEIAAGSSGVSFDPAINGMPAGELERVIDGNVYKFRPVSFFQANSFLIDEMVREVVSGGSGELALDLYCGVGLFTLPLSKQFSRVIGIESD